MIEDSMKGYAWHQTQVQSLRDEMRKKHVPLGEIASLSDIPADDTDPCIIIIGVSDLWVNQVVTEARQLGARIITGRRSGQSHVSSISSDSTDAVEMAVRYLYSLGRRRLALYSVNPASTVDPASANVFRNLVGHGNSIYINNGMLSELFERIEPHLDEYDGILCTNGYAALSLVRHLKELGRDPTASYIVSLADIQLLSRTSPTITSVSLIRNNYGAAVYSIYRILSQPDLFVNSVHIHRESALLIRESTRMEPFVETTPFPPDLSSAPATNSFFADQEIQDIAKLETLLSEGDDIDHAIIEYLLTEKSNREIASLCFLSETAVKYRLKNMREVCGQPDRESLIAYLKSYLSK